MTTRYTTGAHVAEQVGADHEARFQGENESTSGMDGGHSWGRPMRQVKDAKHGARGMYRPGHQGRSLDVIRVCCRHDETTDRNRVES
jgi:hypothetical protein